MSNPTCNLKGTPHCLAVRGKARQCVALPGHAWRRIASHSKEKAPVITTGAFGFPS